MQNNEIHVWGVQEVSSREAGSFLSATHVRVVGGPYEGITKEMSFILSKSWLQSCRVSKQFTNVFDF